MKVENLVVNIEIPEGVEAKLDGTMLNLKGQKGESSRDYKDPFIELKIESKNIVLTAKNATKRQKKQIFSFKSHIKNQIVDCTEGHVYKLKICSGHFPMNVSVSGDMFTIKNFLGEKVPRTIKVKEGANVKVDGQNIIVEGINKERVAQTAANIEQLTRITNRDRRIFQDGIYIIEKDGKVM